MMVEHLFPVSLSIWSVKRQIVDCFKEKWTDLKRLKNVSFAGVSLIGPDKVVISGSVPTYMDVYKNDSVYLKCVLALSIDLFVNFPQFFVDDGVKCLLRMFTEC